jgi:3-methyl-2-oxobutanoate hydroxymethyltransferase
MPRLRPPSVAEVLANNRGHIPKHAKVYRNFAAEYDRLQRERVAAFSEFHRDVQSKAFPEEAQVVNALPGEFEKFKGMLKKAGLTRAGEQVR